MKKLMIVVEQLADWQPYYPSTDLITFTQFLALGGKAAHGKTQVLNLCRSYKYQSQGYYCSLLAEARGQHVLPSLASINDLRDRALYSLQFEELDQVLNELRKQSPEKSEVLSFVFCFGQSTEPQLERFARRLFETYPCPILEVRFAKDKHWQIAGMKALTLRELKDTQTDLFAQALDGFSKGIWRKPRSRKRYKHELAVLVDPDEKIPPSDNKALKLLTKAGDKLGVEVELITKKDYMRLTEYDALFIRTTTSLTNHSYRFAKRAETQGMPVIDDPTSIMRCTNKIYLDDLLRTHQVPTPKAVILAKGDPISQQQAIEQLGFPMVLKIPDGSFSLGVYKVKDLAEMKQRCNELFKQTALVLAQEFLYTDYDWRIGVLDGKPLYACRYYMVRDHWQIYQHGAKTKTGGFDCLPTFEVPRAVLQSATKAANLIGRGLYGVDVKEHNKGAVVIEVNDNPNIDQGVEDLYLGNELYMQLIDAFVSRLEK